MGRLGFDTSGNPVAQVGGTYYDILTSAGGTIEGENEGLLTIKTSAANTYIGFSANSKVGYLGLVNGVLSLSDTQSDGFKTILHSGNIGEYALKLDGSNIAPTTINADNNLDDYRYGYVTYKDSKNPTNSYGDNAVVMALAGAKYNVTFQLAFDGNNGYNSKN
jgi:hypothetical protein